MRASASTPETRSPACASPSGPPSRSASRRSQSTRHARSRRRCAPGDPASATSTCRRASRRELERSGAFGACLIVGGDDRVERFRHPLATGAPVRRLVMAVVVAERGGLHAAATRLACSDALSGEVRAAWRAALTVESRMLSGHPCRRDVRRRVARLRRRLRRGRPARRMARALPGRPDRLPPARVRDRPEPARQPLVRGSGSSPVTPSPGTRASRAAARPRTPS